MSFIKSRYQYSSKHCAKKIIITLRKLPSDKHIHNINDSIIILLLINYRLANR